MTVLFTFLYGKTLADKVECFKEDWNLNFDSNAFQELLLNFLVLHLCRLSITFADTPRNFSFFLVTSPFLSYIGIFNELLLWKWSCD